MTLLFKKKSKPDEFFERMRKQPDDEYKVTKLCAVLLRCKGKYRQVGYKVIDEVLKIGKDPLHDLNYSLGWVRDAELGLFIVDKIASFGMEKEEVHNAIYDIGSLHIGNRKVKNRARMHYDRYYDQATGGNPLKRRDLLIPDW
jgi:hypothetical protein